MLMNILNKPGKKEKEYSEKFDKRTAHIKKDQIRTEEYSNQNEK